MGKKNVATLLLYSWLAFSGCDEESFDGSCCDNPPLVVVERQVRLYLPNAFSPNGDGVNDLFFPSANPGVKKIKSFVVKEGGSVVFSNADFAANFPAAGWDGKTGGDTPGSGIFNFEIIIVTLSDEEMTFSGKVCSRAERILSCVENEADCRFSAQHDGAGGVNSDLVTFESCE